MKKSLRIASSLLLLAVLAGCPVPDDVTPGPGPTPITSELRVLIVHEQADKHKLPHQQVAILSSTTIREYLDRKCVKETGDKPARRTWDQHTDVSRESEVWKKLMAQPRVSLPWIYIGNGTSGYSGPLPANVEDVLTLLKKYGGE